MYVSFKIKRMKALKCKNNANGQKEDLPRISERRLFSAKILIIFYNTGTKRI